MTDEPGDPADNQSTKHQTDSEITPSIAQPRSDANAQTNPESTKPNPQRKKHDCFDWVSLFILVLTFGAAVAAAYEAGRLADSTDRILIDASRAWLAPIGICHNRKAAYVVGEPIKYAIELKNIGKGPALRTIWKVENGFVATPDHKIDVSQTAIDRRNLCDEQSGWANAGTIFPVESPAGGVAEGCTLPELAVQSDALGSGPKVEVTESMLAGTQAFYVRGCFKYETAGITGKTAFCYFVTPYQTPTGPGGAMSTQCRDHNHAE